MGQNILYLSAIWLLVSFFVVGGVVNVIGPKPIQRDYARWGYPRWFHWVTGASEILTAAMLAYQPARMWGVGLGSLVMVGAFSTLLRHGETKHAFLPGTVLTLLGCIAVLR